MKPTKYFGPGFFSLDQTLIRVRDTDKLNVTVEVEIESDSGGCRGILFNSGHLAFQADDWILINIILQREGNAENLGICKAEVIDKWITLSLDPSLDREEQDHTMQYFARTLGEIDRLMMEPGYN
jgi:hypothetical protein